MTTGNLETSESKCTRQLTTTSTLSIVSSTLWSASAILMCLGRCHASGVIAGVIAGMSLEGTDLDEEEIEVVLRAADLVTLARTGVEYDYRGDVIDAHAPEMPTAPAVSSRPELRYLSRSGRHFHDCIHGVAADAISGPHAGDCRRFQGPAGCPRMDWSQ